MSRAPEVRPFNTNKGNNWLARVRFRSRSERKVSVGPDHSQEDGSRASVNSVQLAPVKATSPRDMAAAWISANWIVLIYSTISLALLVLLVYFSFFAASMEDGSKPEFLSCRSWGFGTSCGLWGVDCRPFESEWTAFRCPTRCTLDQSLSLTVYGSSPYRQYFYGGAHPVVPTCSRTSFCNVNVEPIQESVEQQPTLVLLVPTAAAHSTVLQVSVNPLRLFWISITLIPCWWYLGAANSFYSSTANGVTTKEFLSWFPKTIEFKEASSSYCSDLSWWILCIGFIVTAGFGLLPRTSPATMFHLLVAWGFFYTRLIGQPSSQDYAGIIINSYGEVMLLLAASSLAYRIAAANTFRGWKLLSLKRRSVMWVLCYVLPFHVMINMNLIGYIPWLNVDLGGYENVDANAGTYVVFTLVGIGAAFLAFVLLRSVYRGGRWKRFATMYAVLVISVLVSWGLLPSTSFHLHHTMLGAVIIPITAFPTRAAAFSQATALGCFIQGYARWGWHSYLDTIPTYLTIAVPENTPNSTNVTSSGATIWWEPLESVEAYSLRLNRVEVYRGLATTAVISNLDPNITYFVGVAGVASWGTDGRVGPQSNFTTLEA